MYTIYADSETGRMVCDDCCLDWQTYYEVQLGQNDVVQCTNCGAIVRGKYGRRNTAATD